MKKTINVFTIIVIIFSLFLLNSRRNIRIAAPATSLESVEKKLVDTFPDFPPEKQPKSDVKKTINTFADFPPGKQKIVEIEVDEDTFNNFTEREQKDQVLDWLLYTTVYSSGMTADALRDCLYDLPSIRHGYMHAVTNFEYGDTRSCVIGNGNIIALLPRDIPEDRYKGYLVVIADKHRQYLGEEPKKIHLFRYKIDLKGRYALLNRCRDVNAGDLFTGEYGYYSSIVKDLDDFKQFMGKIEDITNAEVVGDGLKLGGRKFEKPYRGIRVEDVAAIWQADKEIQNRHKEFNAKWQHNLDLLNNKLEEYIQPQIETELTKKLLHISYVLFDERDKGRMDNQWNREKILNEYDQEKIEIKEKFQEEMQRYFSLLDGNRIKYDKEQIEKIFSEKLQRYFFSLPHIEKKYNKIVAAWERERVKEYPKSENEEYIPETYKSLDVYMMKYLEKSFVKDKDFSKKIEKLPPGKKELVLEGVCGYQPPEKINSYEDYEQKYKDLHEMREQAIHKERIPGGIGFSLDLTYDFRGLQEAFNDPERLFKVISSLGLNLIEREEIQKAVDALRNDNIVPLLVIIDKLKRCDNDKAKHFAAEQEALVQRYRFHAARYDGLLQGTEVGMVLFYTDLLAKLWALDYLNDIPGKDIENIIPMTAAKVSPIYKQELLGLIHTNLWLGANDKYLKEINYGKLPFARIAHQLYAASTNPLQPGKEEAPNVRLAAFLGWWNGHYEEIARYEPEYERLNEIMKWSILITWLNDANKGHFLDFLQNVKVYKGNWFPEWVKRQPNLKFKEWGKVKFHRPGYLGTEVEKLTILSTRKYERPGLQWTISGGISSAQESNGKKTKPRETEKAKNEERQYRKGEYEMGVGEVEQKRMEEMKMKEIRRIEKEKIYRDYNNIGQIPPEPIPPELSEIKIHSNLGELPKSNVTGSLERLQNLNEKGLNSEIRFQKTTLNIGLEVEGKIGESRLGELKIYKDENGFKIGWKSRDINSRLELAREMSKTENPVDVLLKEPGIESIIRQGEDRFFIKFKNSVTWVKIDREITRKRIAEGYQSKWIEPSTLGNELRNGSSENIIVIGPFNNTGEEMIDVSQPRGPPVSIKLEIDYGYFKIKGLIDPASGEIFIFIKRSVVPSHFWETPDKLQRLVKNDIPIILEKARQHPGDTIRLDRNKPLVPDSVEISLRNGDYRKSAKDIVQNPQQLKSIIHKKLKYEENLIKEFLSVGQYSQAKQHLEDLMAIYGPLPELKIHIGFLLLKCNRDKDAKSQFNDVLSKCNGTNRERILKEINSFLAGSKTIYRFNKENNKTELDYTLDKSVKLQGVTDSEIDNINKVKSHTIYIEDNPSLTNMDWYLATRTGSLAQLIRGRRVKKLLDNDIDKKKPDILNVPVPIELTKKLIDIEQTKRSTYRFIPCNLNGDDDDDDEREKNGEIYLIFAESQK